MASKKAPAKKAPAKADGPKPDKNAPLGSGGRAAAIKEDVMAHGGSAKEAGAIIGIEGRAKYGKEKMAEMSAAGKKRAAAKRKASK